MLKILIAEDDRELRQLFREKGVLIRRYGSPNFYGNPWFCKEKREFSDEGTK
nr:hypothetical protein [uncultured Blautia sp.]